MVRRTSGPRRRTRNLFKKHTRKRGLPPPGRLLVQHEIGEKVNIIIESSVHKGMPYRRFHGRTAEVIGRRGRAYILRVRDGKTYKTIFSGPEHLRPHVG